MRDAGLWYDGAWGSAPLKDHQMPTIAEYAKFLIDHHGMDEAATIARSILDFAEQARGVPLWRRLPDAIQNDLAEMAMEEVGQCTKELAHDNLDGYSAQDLAWVLLVEAGCDDNDGSPEWARRLDDVTALVRSL